MGGGLAGYAKYGGVEAGCALQFAFRAVAGVLLGVMKVYADGAGWFLLTSLVVVSVAEAFGTLGAPIEAERLGALVGFSK